MGGVLASRGSGGGECVLVRLSVTPTARHSMCWTDLTSEKVSDVLRDLGSGFGGLCCRLTDLSSGATDFWSVLDTAGESADQLSAAHPEVKKVKSGTEQKSRRLPLMEVLQQLKRKKTYLKLKRSKLAQSSKPGDFH